MLDPPVNNYNSVLRRQVAAQFIGRYQSADTTPSNEDRLGIHVSLVDTKKRQAYFCRSWVTMWRELKN